MLELNVSATKPALIASLATIDEFVAAEHLEPDLMARLLILVEELFLNTIKYGYRAECDRPVRLRLEAAPGGLTMVYEDEAGPFDPVAWWAGGDRPAAAQSLREGEAGLALLFSLSEHVDYTPLETGNRLTIALLNDRPPGSGR